MASEASFDLVTRNWIPVRWAAGATHEGTVVGLRDVLHHAHEIEALEFGPPPALSALYRVLYALAARVTGLDGSEDDWDGLREERLDKGHLDKDEVDRYFAEHPGRFDLFGERPFLQDPRLRAQCPKPSGLNKLVFGRPAGNNHVWFGHHRDGDPRPLDAEEAVAHLLMWIYYGPSGRCSSRTAGATTAADVSAGPLRGALSYHPEGATLFHTLMAGLIPPARFLDVDEDKCPWEKDLDNPEEAPPRTPGPCSSWTDVGQHALLLVPDATGTQVVDAYATWAFREKRPRTDPYLIWQISQAGNPYARPADSARALWRDVDALLLKDPLGSNQARRPAVFDTVYETDGTEALRVRALGFEQDGKTKDVQYVSGTTPAILDLLKPGESHRAREIGTLRVAGEMYGFRVTLAVKRAWATILNEKMGPCAWAEEAAALYWPEAEREFWSRMHERKYEGAWRSFRVQAEAVYDRVTARAPRTAAAAAAIERARSTLYGGKRAA
ncbi:type I-E CRISPR-associated protein Cse1/CasA [Embleya sp. MST-111070]|uniref:type I-E CRISPR-associated protein Cse1/CasA n=1 Tax=Embleya sp. MST-111070 TaxID=3398231 RepID=UPI003F73F533